MKSHFRAGDPMLNVYLGIDVGSTTTKLVALGSDGTIHASYYRRAHGRPRHVLLELSHQLERDLPPFAILGVGLTGSGGARMSRIIGGIHANELVTQARSVAEYHPDTRTIIEIGGQDSKLLSLQWDENSRQMVLEDFAMNSLCAAGTGSFLDQQAERLGIDIEGEFEEIALSSTNPARIAGRCTVFAKSDMIHLQQEGTPVSDVLAGLCLALAVSIAPELRVAWYQLGRTQEAFDLPEAALSSYSASLLTEPVNARDIRNGIHATARIQALSGSTH